MRRITALAFAAFAAPSMALAIEVTPSIENYITTGIKPWMTDSILVDAVIAQNQMTVGYGAAEIDALDQQWRAEVGTVSDLVDGVIMNAASEFLRSQVDASGGRITEVILMDAQGLNVAASGATSDYWQGDEAKHQATYGVGIDAIHVGDIEFDESSQMYQAQISLTLTDPASGEAIGAITVAVDADSLM